MNRHIISGIAFMLIMPLMMNAQTVSKYDHEEAFAPIFYPAYGDDVRTASGAPGPHYWQNRADYKIKATLDDVNHRITGSVTVTYKNNSPEKMSFLWVQLDQNIYNQKSRGIASTAPGARWANRHFGCAFAALRHPLRRTPDLKG